MKSLKNALFLAGAAISLATSANAATVITSGTTGTTGATALYMTDLSEISASASASTSQFNSWLGTPDDDHTGIGGQFITYDLGDFRMVDAAGQDLNVYEVDFGAVEFGLATFSVSADGVTFSDISASSMGALDLAGDEAHSNANFRRSYDLNSAALALGTSEFRYFRIDGNGTGILGGNRGFDPDSIGFANFTNLAGGIPEPTTWAMLIFGFGAIGAAMRRKKAIASVSYA